MKLIYGIDLSKSNFDVNFIKNSKKECHVVVKNTFNGIVKFLETVPKHGVLVAEHTGVYGDLLVYLAAQLDIRISLSSGYSIKHSLGLQKGKTDKLDARRIREYGERFYDRLQDAKPTSEALCELHELYSLRKQLVKERKMLLCHKEKEYQAVFNSIIANNIKLDMLETFNKSINTIEEEIVQIIQSHHDLNRNYDLITSVKGVGPVTTCDLIIKTNNFTKISEARKVASYAGVCPYPNASGKMVKKSKVSAMSDKDLKTLLFMCAKSAVKHNMQYKLYYQKKQLEGKHHYLIMNNVANKLLRTICRLIETGESWDPNHICLDPRELKNIA